MRQQTLALAFHTLQAHEVSIDIKMHFIEQSVHASCKNGKRKADTLKSVSLFTRNVFSSHAYSAYYATALFYPFYLPIIVLIE